ncbi:hypothetical protein D5R81_12290 [Parashewanella spongiae]|uniref:Uncharacterized protein n=1 Tax=Parashewanella spongiae TaxID=342950 RepID=A0A3A6TUB9_9GAMM|nr:hypothetical protein D5R81_12290 [Parashewanella spongiae]
MLLRQKLKHTNSQSNIDMKSLSLPSLTSNFLQRSGIQIDNSFSTSWKQLGFISMLTFCGFSKRSGIEPEIIS